MRLNKEEIEAFVQDQTADDAIEVQEILSFRCEPLSPSKPHDQKNINPIITVYINRLST